MLKSWATILITITLILSSFTTNAQLLENSLFRIYRAEFILGTVTHLRFDSDSTYEMRIIEIHCSLCDHDKLNNSINKTGTWTQNNDTIVLDSTKKLLVLGDTTLHPLYPVGIDIDTTMSKKQENVLNRMINNNLNDFHLIYDTYPNGIARLIFDKYRMRKNENEYEIELTPNVIIKKVKY